jgi:hypothetical protein
MITRAEATESTTKASLTSTTTLTTVRGARRIRGESNATAAIDISIISWRCSHPGRPQSGSSSSADWQNNGSENDPCNRTCSAVFSARSLHALVLLGGYFQRWKTQLGPSPLVVFLIVQFVNFFQRNLDALLCCTGGSSRRPTNPDPSGKDPKFVHAQRRRESVGSILQAAQLLTSSVYWIRSLQISQIALAVGEKEKATSVGATAQGIPRDKLQVQRIERCSLADGQRSATAERHPSSAKEIG